MQKYIRKGKQEQYMDIAHFQADGHMVVVPTNQPTHLLVGQ
jgi:hypothetical protein